QEGRNKSKLLMTKPCLVLQHFHLLPVLTVSLKGRMRKKLIKKAVVTSLLSGT
ncbi:hypothetical protein S83_008714, partial [Arachis hypogaea]